MRNVVLLFVFLCMGIAVLNAVQIRSAGSGNWYNPATWENGTIPGPYDDVLIRSSHYVNLEGSFQLQVNSLQLGDVESQVMTASLIGTSNYHCSIYVAENLAVGNGNISGILTPGSSAQHIFMPTAVSNTNFIVMGHKTSTSILLSTLTPLNITTFWDTILETHTST